MTAAPGSHAAPAPRSPLETLGRLAASAAGVGAAVWLVVVVSAPMLARTSSSDGRALGTAGLAIAFALFAVLTGLAAQSVWRALPAYRAIVRAARDSNAPPPSSAALRDAARAPRRALWTTASMALVAAAAVALALGGSSAGLAASAITLGVVLLAASPIELAFERSLGAWLGELPTLEIAPLPGWSDASRAAHHATSIVLGSGFVAAGVAAGAGGNAIVGPIASLVVAGATAFVTAHLARRFKSDRETLLRRLRALAEGAGRDLVAGGAGDLIAAGIEDREVQELARAVERHLGSSAASAAAEQRARSSLEEIQRTKTMFVASMSHDLRSPLNSILGFSELLLSPRASGGGELAPAQRESIEMIRRAGSELLDLLNDIIDSARFDAGRLPLRREWVPSVEILTEAMRQGREMLAQRGAPGIEIEAGLDPGLPPVWVDRDRIVQAVVCIFRHATRSTERGTIRIEARFAAGRDHVEMTVRDRGGGVSAQDRERLFEAFRAVTSVDGRRIGGLGLSLALARSLVRAHGGDVAHASSGNETAFSVRIPTRRRPTGA